MLTSPDTRATRGWLRLGGAILVLTLLTGCAGSSSASPSRPPGGTSGASSATSAPDARGSASTSRSAQATLAAALAPLKAASAFETRVDVDGRTVVSAVGRAVGSASRLTVTTTGKSVEYVEIPPRAWAREASGTWILVAAEQAPGSPLDSLADPLMLTAATDGSGTLTATYPAKALGLEGDPLTVTITIDGGTVTFRYEATAEGRKTSSTTIIRPGKTDPITAPAG